MVDYARPFTQGEVDAAAHRSRVGGKWRRLGRLQFDFMRGQELRPDSLLLDVGCGALRGGAHFVSFLDPGHYYGIDVNQSLLDAGYDRELAAELRDKLPRDNLRATGRFDCDFGVAFDFALAQSLFTHAPLNGVRLCLYRVAKVMRPGGRFYATFFEPPQDLPLDGVIETRRGISTERNPFWYWPQDLEWAASFAPWRFRYIGDWGHPRDQRMVEFTRR
ncbi:MAG: class I SAM-dependent methyltransferase [Streptosporangiaceae bacterium]